MKVVIAESKSKYEQSINTFSINDSRLSLGAIGLHLFLMQIKNFDPNWKIYLEDLAKNRSTTGRKGTNSIINELIENKYIIRHIKREKGKFSSYEYFVYMTPYDLKLEYTPIDQIKTGESDRINVMNTPKLLESKTLNVHFAINKNLSWKEKGLFAKMLLIEQTFSLTDLYNISKSKRGSINDGIDELVKTGYLLKNQKYKNNLKNGYSFEIILEPKTPDCQKRICGENIDESMCHPTAEKGLTVENEKTPDCRKRIYGENVDKSMGRSTAEKGTLYLYEKDIRKDQNTDKFPLEEIVYENKKTGIHFSKIFMQNGLRPENGSINFLLKHNVSEKDLLSAITTTLKRPGVVNKHAYIIKLLKKIYIQEKKDLKNLTGEEKNKASRFTFETVGEVLKSNGVKNTNDLPERILKKLDDKLKDNYGYTLEWYIVVFELDDRNHKLYNH